MTLALRVPAILLGVLVGYFALCLYRITKGGSNGWLYLSVKGMCLFFWAITALLFTLIDIPLLRYLSGAIFLFGIAFTFPITYTKLARDFGAEMPKWFNVKTCSLVVVGAYLLLLVGNVLTDNFREPLVTLLTISHLSLGIGALIAIYPTYILMKATNQNPWKLAFLFAVVIALGMNFGQYYNNCCHEDGIMTDEPVCEGYDLDYNKIYGSPCIGAIVGIGKFYQLSLVAGIIILLTALYQLNSRLKF